MSTGYIMGQCCHLQSDGYHLPPWFARGISRLWIGNQNRMAQRPCQVQESKEAFLRMAFFKIDHLCLFPNCKRESFFNFWRRLRFKFLVLFHLNEKQVLAAQVEKNSSGTKSFGSQKFCQSFFEISNFDFSSQSSSHRLLRTEAEVYTLQITFYNRWVKCR